MRASKAGSLRLAEGLRVVLAPLVEGGEPLVGVAPYEPFGDARLVEVDRPLRVAVSLCLDGLGVALHRCLEALQGVFLSPDPLPLGGVEAEEW